MVLADPEDVEPDLVGELASSIRLRRRCAGEIARPVAGSGVSSAKV